MGKKAKRGTKWYESAAEQENEYVRAVILEPGHPLQEDALELAVNARDMAARSLGEDHPACAEAAQNIGLYYSVLGGDPEQAAEFFDEARATVGPYHPVLTRTFYFLGVHHRQAGDPGQARKFLQEVLDIIRREGHAEDPRIEQLTEMLTELGPPPRNG
ncbi:tetratricopeptide repeat protein [Streptomyces canus]|uniref:tetratricopeptide repeat protein n=1 Tax=Streptomyces canus TaxID=58343 RepID=UPI0036D02639